MLAFTVKSDFFIGRITLLLLILLLEGVVVVVVVVLWTLYLFIVYVTTIVSISDYIFSNSKVFGE